VPTASTLPVHLSPLRGSARESAAHRGSRDARATGHGRTAQAGGQAEGGRL